MQQFNIWTVDRTKAALLDLPPKIWYGKIHQAGYGYGGSKGQNKAAGIPPRPFALIQDEDYAKIDLVFETWFMERMAVSRAFTPGSRRR
jgi:phage gpG-like protein